MKNVADTRSERRHAAIAELRELAKFMPTKQAAQFTRLLDELDLLSIAPQGNKL